jgi:hypothetical protein
MHTVLGRRNLGFGKGDCTVDAKRSGIPDIVRNTLEYQEARTILVEQAKARAELKRINAELKQVRRLSPAAVALAKIDSENGLADP